MEKKCNANLVILLINITLSVALCIVNIFYQAPAPNWDLTLKFVGSGIFVLIGAINLICGIIKKNINFKFSLTIFIGLLLSFGGDVAIEYEFIIGAALFALAHVAYIVGFYFVNKFHWLDIAISLVMAIPAALTIALLPSIQFNDEILRYVVVGYSIIISFMFGKSLSNLILKHDFHSIIIFIGAILFVLSDLFLLCELFIFKDYHWGHACMALYFPALIVLAFSVYFQNKKILK